MTQREDDDCGAAGLLHGVPGSWLRLLIRCLPKEDRLALFQASRWLARHVVGSAERFYCNVPQGNPHDVHHSSLAGILADATQGVRIHLPVLVKPDFACLGKLAVSLSVSNCTGRCFAMPNMEWAALPNLKSLSLHDCAHEEGISQLTQALQAGHLHKLQAFDLNSRISRSLINSQGVLEELACALQQGTKLTSIKTDAIGLLARVHGFLALESVCLERLSSASDVIMQLCSHPTVVDIIVDGYRLEKYGLAACEYKSVTVESSNIKVLSCLPLSSIQQIIFVDAHALRFEDERKALNDVLAKHASKVVCKPKGSRFWLYGVCNGVLQLARHFDEVQELAVSESVQSASTLTSLWLALPPCVRKVLLHRDYGTGTIEGLDWAKVWTGLPATVTHVCIDGCHGVSCEVLAALERDKPMHVQELQILNKEKIGLVRSNSFPDKGVNIWEVILNLPMTLSNADSGCRL